MPEAGRLVSSLVRIEYLIQNKMYHKFTLKKLHYTLGHFVGPNWLNLPVRQVYWRAINPTEQ